MSSKNRFVFEENRIRSKSVDPSRRYQKTNIFNFDKNLDNLDDTFNVSEYKKSFDWPKNLSKLSTNNIRHAGLSSSRCAAKQLQIVHNSNGSTSIIEPTEFAQTTNSATNLVSLNNNREQFCPFTSMALLDLNNLNVITNDKKTVNKSATINNLNDLADLHDLVDLKEKNTNVKASEINNQKKNSPFKTNKNQNNYESIYGKKAGASVLFNKEPAVDDTKLNKIPKKTEYKSKFKPFSTYVYLSGKGWLKPKNLTVKQNKILNEDAVDKIVNRHLTTDATNDIQLKGEPWYKEVLERNSKANEFRNRSEFGNPILGRKSLEEIYKKVSDNNWHACNDIKLFSHLKVRNKEFISMDSSSGKNSDNSLRPSISTTSKPMNKTTVKLRPVSVPPRNIKSTLTASKTNTANTAKTNQDKGNKVWIKAKKDETCSIPKPIKTSINNENKKETINKNDENNNLFNQKNISKDDFSSPPPIINLEPVKTTNIQKTENLIGIKSPTPENWLVEVDQDEINWKNTTDMSNITNAYSTMLI